MAENSALWLGSTLGDAASVTGWKGPYSVADFSEILSLMTASDDNEGFVVPGYNNNLEVTASSPVAMTVDVDTGAALVRGKLYENTASNTISIAANASGNPRIDRVILRLGVAAQTIRLIVLQGTPGVAPALPTLTQDAATYEVSLAYIWVPNGAATIPDTDIHDERAFASSYRGINDSYGSPNLIYNSEFMAFSELSTADPTTNPPDYWELVGTPSAMTESTAPAQMLRGRAIEITVDAASEGISQTVPVASNMVYSIKLLTQVTSGDEGSIVVTTDSAAPGTITRYVKRVSEWIEERIFYTAENDATAMTVRLLGLNNTDVVEYGQVLIREGYYPGTFLEEHETIIFQRLLEDAAWGGAGGGSYTKSSGTTTIDLDADFQTLVPDGVIALNIRHLFVDSGSAAGTCYITARPVGSTNNFVMVETSGETPLTYRIEAGWVFLDSNNQFDFTILATGVNTAQGFSSIIGIET